MKRTDILLKIEEMLVEAPEDISEAAESILSRLEKAGMTPPCVDSNRVQALLQVYIDPSLNMWDEEFEKDEKLTAAYKRRMSK